MSKVQIFTDGAARGNPDGPGGYGAVLQFTDSKGQLHEKTMSAGYVRTTNNRMELSAAIAGLAALKEPCEVELYSDSKYLVDAVNLGWARSWHAKGWRKGDGKPALNVDLWEQLLMLLDIHRVKFEWVRGHNGHVYNERCDRLAVLAAEKYQ